MMKAIVEAIKNELSVEVIDSYTEHGCNIIAPIGCDLYVIRYSDAVQSVHPRAGDFGSMSFYDGLDAAKALAEETFDGLNVLTQLAIPDYVFTVPFTISE